MPYLFSCCNNGICQILESPDHTTQKNGSKDQACTIIGYMNFHVYLQTYKYESF